MKATYYYFGLILTCFNILVFILTDDKIYPKYFEFLFAIYFAISFILGLNLRWNNSKIVHNFKQRSKE